MMPELNDVMPWPVVGHQRKKRSLGQAFFPRTSVRRIERRRKNGTVEEASYSSGGTAAAGPETSAGRKEARATWISSDANRPMAQTGIHATLFSHQFLAPLYGEHPGKRAHADQTLIHADVERPATGVAGVIHGSKIGISQVEAQGDNHGGDHMGIPASAKPSRAGMRRLGAEQPAAFGGIARMQKPPPDSPKHLGEASTEPTPSPGKNGRIPVRAHAAGQRALDWALYEHCREDQAPSDKNVAGIHHSRTGRSFLHMLICACLGM